VTYLLGEAYNGLVGWRILLLALELEEEERAALVARCGCCDRSHWQLLDNIDDEDDANVDTEGAVVMTLPRKWMDRFAAACKSWDAIFV
jgi:hypothetical protein